MRGGNQHPARYFLVSKPVHLSNQENLPALLWQRCHSFAIHSKKVLCFNFRLGRNLYIKNNRRAYFLNEVGDLTGFSRQLVERDVSSDSKQERLRLLNVFFLFGFSAFR